MLTDHRMTATWVLGLLAVLTVTSVLVLLRQWQRGRLIIDRRQLAARVLGGVALLGIWVLLGFMLLYLDPRTQVRALVLCFAGTLALTGLLLVMAVLDLRLLNVHRVGCEARLALEVSRGCTAPRHTSELV